jgi:Tfp pilus assembly protein PilO
MLKIHDIKPIIEIPSYSYEIYILSIVLVVLLVLLVGFFIYRYFKNKQNTKEKEYYNILKNIDFKDSKNSAYTISKYGRYLAKSERQIKLINELHHNLEEFKYKKHIDKEIPLNIKSQFDRFLESLDV